MDVLSDEATAVVSPEWNHADGLVDTFRGGFFLSGKKTD